MDISKKIAIVTGISRGIGKEVAQSLLNKGAKVFGFGKTLPDFSHANLKFIKSNVGIINNVDKAVKQVKETENRIDILINNAGLGYFGYFEEMSEEEFKEMIDVNVYGIFHTCRYIIPMMKAQRFGHIINISSIAGLEGMAQAAGYCGAKHAVRGITDSLFRELREFGIKVTGVYPGSTRTDFFNNAHGIKPHDYMMSPKEVAEQIIRVIETSDNFLINELVFRPLIPKPPKQ